MSSKIYFGNQQQLLRPLVRIISEAWRFLHPHSAEKQLRRLLLTPKNHALKAIPDNVQSLQLGTQYGDLTYYTVGEGPVILFIHGWSGAASQFFTLMQLAANSGYRAIAFDHFKHGRSGGVENNYPLFIKTIDIVKTHFQNDKIQCVVSHSMGGSVALDYFRDSQLPQFLIAPLFNFYGELKSRITGVGISPQFFEKIISNIEKDYNMPVKDREPMAYIKNIAAPIAIVHSKDDRFALYDYSHTVSVQQKNIALITLSGVGHMRIVSDSGTQTAFSNFLTQLP